MNLAIRRGTVDDAAALADIAARTFFDTFAAQNRPEDMELHAQRSYGVEKQTQELLNPDVITLLVDCDGVLAGFAQLCPGRRPPFEVELDEPVQVARFYVDKAWHGRGVAQALMQAVEDEARQRNARTMWLGVWERNDRAKAFYAKFGFVDIGVETFCVGNDLQTDRVMMRKLQVWKAAARRRLPN